MPTDTFLKRLRVWTASWNPDDAVFPIILANFQINEDETISPHLKFDRHMQIVRAMWESPTYELFKRVHCPVLFIPARGKEPLAESEKRFMEAKERGIEIASRIIPNLQVAWMNDSIHDLPLQRPSELADLIADFDNKVVLS